MDLRVAELRRCAFIICVSLLAAARALPVEHHHDDHGHVDHACPYDALGPEVVVRAPQEYASSRSPRRRLNATDPNAGWSSLRIHVIDAVTGAGVLDAASEAAVESCDGQKLAWPRMGRSFWSRWHVDA